MQMSDSLKFPSIDLPPSLFDQIRDTTTITQSDNIAVVFTFYENSTLLPVGEHTANDTSSFEVTRVATEIIAAHVMEESIDGLQDPVTVILKRKKVLLVH